MPKAVSWATVTIMGLLCGTYVVLAATHHEVPPWLAGVSGTIITGLFPAAFPRMFGRGSPS